jgi:hypothetical protein
MTIPVPLSVRLRTDLQDIHITDDIADLSFGNASPGGYTECTTSLFRPISFTPGEVAQFGRMYVYDGTNGNVVWEGIMQDPGRSSGQGGDTFELAAVGGSTCLQDDTRQLYYVDTDFNHFIKIDNTTAASQIDQISDVNLAGDSVMQLRIPQGTAVDGAIPSLCVSGHVGIAEAGQKLARVSFDWDTGLTAATLTSALYAATTGVGAADVAWSATFNSAGGTISRVVGTDWTNGRNRPIIRFHYTGAAGNVSADTWWLQISNLVVRTMLYLRDGTERTSPYSTDTLLASEVVADLLGRILGAQIDGANATIAVTTYLIEHLVYPDGVNPAQVLDDMIAFERAYTYHVWDSNPNNDLFRFEWVPWPSVIRYEADVLDGFSAPASGNTIYDRVMVRWHNRGVTHVSLRTQVVPALVAAGYSRTAYIDLGDEASTATNAHQVGDQFLAEHQYPVNAGRLTITGPIVDYLYGRMVNPWEIRAGSLIRVRGVAAYTDSLNSNGRDGLTVFKVAAVSYSASESAATLDLDSYAPSLARAVAKIASRPFVRRR